MHLNAVMTTATNKLLEVQIWSDIACPWCYVGKRRFEAALKSFANRDSVKLTWRSFELDPTAPLEQPREISYVRRLATKYGSSEAQAQAMINNMTAVAEREGVQMNFEHIRPGNTLHAHRLLHFAHEHGRQDQLKEQLFRAYLCDGKLVSSREVLLEAAQAAGLDEEKALSVIATDAYEDGVRADQNLARQHGISGVPFFAIGRYGVSGAQPAEALHRVLEKAWQELPAAPAPEDAAAPMCGPDGCTV